MPDYTPVEKGKKFLKIGNFFCFEVLKWERIYGIICKNICFMRVQAHDEKENKNGSRLYEGLRTGRTR